MGESKDQEKRALSEKQILKMQKDLFDYIGELRRNSPLDLRDSLKESLLRFEKETGHLLSDYRTVDLSDLLSPMISRGEVPRPPPPLRTGRATRKDRSSPPRWGPDENTVGVSREIHSLFFDVLIQLKTEVGLETKSILDPFARPGGLLREAEKIFHPEVCVGVYKNKLSYDLEHIFSPAESIQERIHKDNLLALEEGVGDQFDIVLSAPPLGLKSLGAKIEKIQIRDREEHIGVLKSSCLLNESGIGIFLLTPSFFATGSKTVFNNLHNFGLYVDAVFVSPNTSRFFGITELHLVIIKSGEAPKSMFVGEFSKDESPESAQRSEFKQTVSKYLRQWDVQPKPFSDNVHPSKGVNVKREEFVNFRSLERHYELGVELNKLPKDFTKYRLGDLVSVHKIEDAELSRVINNEDEEVTRLFAESIFLCLRKGTKWPRAVGGIQEVLSFTPIDVDDLKKSFRKIKDYWVRLEIESEKVNKTSLIQYLNGHLGELACRALAKGNVFERLSRSDVEKIEVGILTSVKNQELFADAKQKLADYKRDLEIIESNFERNPGNYKKIETELKELGGDPDFWKDYPFPLANILWKYETLKEEDVEKKAQQLEVFFESLQIFVTSLIMGAVQGSSVYEEHLSSWIEELDRSKKGSWAETTWATWSTIHEISAKKIRTDLDNKAEEEEPTLEYWKKHFACSNHDFLRVIVGKDLVALLQEARGYRNRLGHEGNKEWIKQTQLPFQERNLKEVKNLFRNYWDNYLLVEVGNTRQLDNERYEIDTKLIMGTNPEFRNDVHSLVSNVLYKRLYLIEPDFGYHCLFPQVGRLGEPPEKDQNVFYFFNKTEKGRAKYTSYHYDGDATTVYDFEHGVLNDLFGSIKAGEE
ncbi:MAG: hypothetical protein ACJZ2F_04190 [Acidimicrobiales bacterium]